MSVAALVAAVLPLPAVPALAFDTGPHSQVAETDETNNARSDNIACIT